MEELFKEYLVKNITISIDYVNMIVIHFYLKGRYLGLRGIREDEVIQRRVVYNSHGVINVRDMSWFIVTIPEYFAIFENKKHIFIEEIINEFAEEFRLWINKGVKKKELMKGTNIMKHLSNFFNYILIGLSITIIIKVICDYILFIF